MLIEDRTREMKKIISIASKRLETALETDENFYFLLFFPTAAINQHRRVKEITEQGPKETQMVVVWLTGRGWKKVVARRGGGNSVSGRV